MSAIDIYVSDVDESYLIGSAIPPDDCQDINELWNEWREAEPEPDCDSDFVVWLVEEKGWADAPTRDSHTIVIG